MNKSVIMMPLSAVELLRAEHRQIQSEFVAYTTLTPADDRLKEKFVNYLSRDLLRHMIVEEDVFYPPLRKKIPKGADLLTNAVAEHEDMKQLIAQLEAMTPQDELFDETIAALSKQFNAHIADEESSVFALVEQSDLNLLALADDMRSARRLLN